MARPVDWSPLAGSDPVPGDPYEVARMGRHYTDVADAIDRAASKLRQLAGGNDDQESDAVDALDDDCQQVADDISRAHKRYAGVGAALTTYFPALEQAQADSLAALTAAQQADSSHRAATTRQNDAQSPGEHDAAQQDIDAANTALGSARTKLQHAIEHRDNAARTAVNAIKDVQDSGDLNDSWWDNWGHKIVEVIQKIASAVAMVAGILALCVGWIPIIGQALAGILGTIALVASAISLVCNIALAATGYGSWWDVGLDAIAVATFGLGRVFTTAARASTTTVQGLSRMGAGSLAAEDGALSIRGLMGGSGLADISRTAARGLRVDGLAGQAINGRNIVGALRAIPGSFGADLSTLTSGASWTATRTAVGPAFRSIFTGGGARALYGETELLEHTSFVAGLDRAVTSLTGVSQAIHYTQAMTVVGLGANAAGNLGDFYNALGNPGLPGGDSDFNLNLGTDPMAR
jgi:hypothetical protein